LTTILENKTGVNKEIPSTIKVKFPSLLAMKAYRMSGDIIPFNL